MTERQCRATQWRRYWCSPTIATASDVARPARASGRSAIRRSPACAARLAAAIAQQSGWVTQGVYLWWCEPLARHADRIVWLDVPWRVAASRIIRRHRLATRTRSRRQPGLAQRVRLAWATRHYYLGGTRDAGVTADDNDDDAITRAATREWLEPYRDKLLRCAAVRDLDEIVSVASGKPGMRRDD